MANLFLLHLLVLTITTATLPLISTAQSPAPSTPVIQNNDQFNKIIDALIGAGDFAGWANVLSNTDPSTLPLTATFFIPTNDAVSNFTGISNVDPFLIPYHIVPQRLTFSDLKKFSTRTRLPTLLPYKYVVVTNNSSSNFTVDDSQIIHPDVFENAAFSVHGIRSVMDYSVFGGGEVLAPAPAVVVNDTSSLRRKPKPKRTQPEIPVEVTIGPSCGALRICSEFVLICSVGFAVFLSRFI